MKKEECRMHKSQKARSLAFAPFSALRLLPSAFAYPLILLVRIYQLTLSPAKTFLFGSAAECRFEPSCSEYALEALKTHGAMAGTWLATRRICRCHPWGGCGHDPVPPVKPRIGNSKTKVRPILKRATPAEFRT